MMTEFCINNIWLVPLLPLLGAFLNGLYTVSGARLVRPFVHNVACGAMLLSFLVAVGAFFHLVGLPAQERIVTVSLWEWIQVGSLHVNVAFLVDPLSITLTLVVTGVGFLIHVYSIGYMHHEPSYSRYFSYLNLFSFAMLLLVLGDNLLLMFVGWEGVGLCSYLLIGFWFTDMEKATAGMKAFVVNRIGDFAFVAGLLLLYWTLDGMNSATLTFVELRDLVPSLQGATWMGVSVVGLVTLLLFIGATGKSAQIPLYVWLPDAMAGPTPVSALIHAATMVTAGVYMIARLSHLYILAPETLAVVGTVGFLTAIFAASIGLVQNDIKKVLAYSTVSQLGYMFGALGVMAFTAGIFHLITHAFFKALLFLGSGSVIHAMSNHQDMRVMGGLKDKMPITYKTFLIGTFAIAGIFPFAGFFSKDEILWHAFEQNTLLWVMGLSAALMTAFYMFRLVSMTFYGQCRADAEVQSHIHESPSSMTFPLIVLAILSILGGFIGVPLALGHLLGWEHPHLLEAWLAPSLAHLGEGGHHEIPIAEYVLMLLSLGIAVGGCYLGYYLYTKRQDIPQKIAATVPRLYQTLLNKYFVDEFYFATFVAGTRRLMSWLASFDLKVIDGVVNFVGFVSKIGAWISGWFDQFFVDGLVNRVADSAWWSGKGLRHLQTGKIQNYVYVLVVGVLVLMFWRLT
jgi:NADH-quinone oxidoreductase subunit L